MPTPQQPPQLPPEVEVEIQKNIQKMMGHVAKMPCPKHRTPILRCPPQCVAERLLRDMILTQDQLGGAMIALIHHWPQACMHEDCTAPAVYDVIEMDEETEPETPASTTAPVAAEGDTEDDADDEEEHIYYCERHGKEILGAMAPECEIPGVAQALRMAAQIMAAMQSGIDQPK